MSECNPQAELARRYVLETGVSVFLTGKAGTGKTTFLRNIVERCPKRHVVLAPTGVAAVNAGGVTIHSFFQLPFCPYLPDVPELVTEYQMPEHSRQLRKSKIDIIRTLDLLIIDEISMVRADLLDAVDDSLRRYRRSSRPFGGVQLLLIGDAQQLAPVVTDDEKPYMDRVYPSPFFFHSKALRRVPYVTIQLTTVYRQQDPAFVALLNNIRENRFDRETLAALNARAIAPAQPRTGAKEASDPILLTTHNYQADRVNSQRLAALNTKPYSFEAVVSGNFPASSAPVDTSLVLKPGAQVMFVKNDSSGAHRYFNGKIGTVEEVVEETDDEGRRQRVIMVRDEEGDLIRVTPETWENIRYDIDPADNQIKQHVDGTLSQYPLRTAWAVTIHKAQGLTFDRVQVDAADAFAYGQVYVALSRCRTLEGLTLLSPISERCAFGSEDIEQFNATFTPPAQAEEALEGLRRQYFYDQLFELFGFSALQHDVEQLNRLFQENLRTTYPQQCGRLSQQSAAASSLADVADRFRRQLTDISRLPDEEGRPLLEERVRKAAVYFGSQVELMDDSVRPLLGVSIDNKAVARRAKELGDRYCSTADLKIAVLNQVQREGFDVEKYQKAKVDSVLAKPKKAKEARGGKAAEDYSDSLHPKMVRILTRWRKEKAHESKLPAYTVIQQKSLLAIADLLPRDSKALKKIPGIGEAKAAQYGAELLQMIEDYCEEQEQKKEPVWLRAARLYAETRSVEEVAGQMLRSVSTVEGYLFTAVENGAMDPDLILPPEGQEEVVHYLLDHPEVTLLKPVYEYFDSRYTYLQLRVARHLLSPSSAENS